jgi:membrane protein required for beta-lactamase induction
MLAITSLIAGILGFTAFPVLGMLVALITGYMARQETRATPPTASGDGLATAGIVMGWIQVALIVLAFCCIGAALVFSFGVAGTSIRGN